MTEALKELASYIETKRPDCVLEWDIAFDELTITISPSSLVSFSEFLKTDAACRFSTMVDMTAVDHPTRDMRFDVVYHFRWWTSTRRPTGSSVKFLICSASCSRATPTCAAS